MPESDEVLAENKMISSKDTTLTPVVQTSENQESVLSAEAQLFRYREKMQHYVIVIVNDKKIRATELQIQIANFNAKYYSNIGYKVSTAMFTDSLQLLTIHRYVDAKEAVNYWQHLQQPESPLSAYNESDYRIFPISTQNYTTFYKRKEIEAYQEFFDKYYKE